MGSTFEYVRAKDFLSTSSTPHLCHFVKLFDPTPLSLCKPLRPHTFVNLLAPTTLSTVTTPTKTDFFRERLQSCLPGMKGGGVGVPVVDFFDVGSVPFSVIRKKYLSLAALVH